MTTSQNTIVREECTNDHDRVEFMTREAFWNVYAPGATEHYIVHKLRDSSSFVKELSLIACQKDTIVGHVMYSKAKVVETGGKEHEVLCMGPLTVDPAYQKNGIGSLLIKESTKRARALGYKGVIIFGNPQYYHRFGYVSADTYGITTSGGQNFDPFMVLELLTGEMDGIHGKFFEDEIFNVNPQDLENFEIEKNFPFKEKLVLDTQLKGQ